MKCLLCGNNEIKTLKIVKKVKIFNCVNCGLGFIDQRKSKSVSADFLYNFGEYNKRSAILKNRYTKLADIIFKFKKRGKLLDIGGGFGLFSSIIQDKGNFEITAIDLKYQPKYLHKPFLFKKYNLNEFLKINKKGFDLIILMDVIEHLNNPSESLEKIKKILNINGLLVIQTPNYNSLMAKLCRDWSWWMVEDHKYFFTQHSIKLLLKKTGFNIKYFKTYEDFSDFKKNLDGNFISIKNNYLRKFTKLIFFTLFLPFYFLTRKIIWNFGYGGLIFLIAEKEVK